MQISRYAGTERQATLLGLLTLAGLFLGALVQPAAGVFSDRWKPVLGRKGTISIGLGLCLLCLFFFAKATSLFGLMTGYILVQMSAVTGPGLPCRADRSRGLNRLVRPETARQEY